jgi:hypothetical protein
MWRAETSNVHVSRDLQRAPFIAIKHGGAASDDIHGFSRFVLRNVPSDVDDDTVFSACRYATIKLLESRSFRPCLDAFAYVAREQQSAIEAGNWEAAIEPALFVLAVYLLVYERCHPLVGLQVVLVGKAVWNYGDVEVVKRELGWIVKMGKECLVAGRHERARGELDELHSAYLSVV